MRPIITRRRNLSTRFRVCVQTALVFAGNDRSNLDIYWENVGGETLDAVLLKANNFARIIACGMISQYGNENPYGVKNLSLIVGKRIRMEGFIQSDFREKYHVVYYYFSPNVRISSAKSSS